MAKQKQPRPDFIMTKSRLYTYHGMSVVGGVTTYPKYEQSMIVFRKIIQFPTYNLSTRGLMGLNPLSASYVSQERFAPVVRRPKGSPWDTSRVYSVGITNKTDPNASKVRQGAINKFMTELSDARVDLLMLFAERQKTINMVANRIWQAYYFLRALKKGDKEKAVRILKNGKQPTSKKGAGLHLEIYYGWLQLAGDIHSLINKQQKPVPSKRYKVPYSKPWGGSENLTAPPGSDNPVGSRVWFGRTRYIVIADIELDMPVIASASILGLTNPAYVAWDALPNSLVVDWFFPIGPWLESMSALDGFHIKDQLLCEKKKFESYNETDSGSSHFKSVYFSRTKSFDLKYQPLFKNPLSIIHAINGLAMLRQYGAGDSGKPFKNIFP